MRAAQAEAGSAAGAALAIHNSTGPTVCVACDPITATPSLPTPSYFWFMLLEMRTQGMGVRPRESGGPGGKQTRGGAGALPMRAKTYSL